MHRSGPASSITKNFYFTHDICSPKNLPTRSVTKETEWEKTLNVTIQRNTASGLCLSVCRGRISHARTHEETDMYMQHGRYPDYLTPSSPTRHSLQTGRAGMSGRFQAALSVNWFYYEPTRIPALKRGGLTLGNSGPNRSEPPRVSQKQRHVPQIDVVV